MPQRLSTREIRRRTKQIRRAIDGTRRRLINLKFIRTAQFPYRPPALPKGIDPLPKKSKTGSSFKTDWARRTPAQTFRMLFSEFPMRPIIQFLAKPSMIGIDSLADIPNYQPVIFVANHHSHIDTPLLLTSLPIRWRKKLVVGAAADYFFSTRITGTLSALFIGAIPIERRKITRKSSDDIADLIDKGWSFMVFPEGGRSPDGWGQPFRGGAAYLSLRCNAPIVPIHITGTGAILRKGRNLPKPSKTTINFGRPIWPGIEESSRSLAKRIEVSVAQLADETSSNWWEAKKRLYEEKTPTLHGPEASSWRRAWELSGRKRKQQSPSRNWPKI